MVPTRPSNPSDSSKQDRIAVALCWTQGVYWLITGCWPLISINTFQAVTGPKADNLATGLEADHWLVNTVAVLIVADSFVFLVAAIRSSVSFDVVVLGITSTTALMSIDILYASRGTISRVYLADAGLELLLMFLWIWCLVRRRPI
jgi:hypothetical protein